MHRGLSELRAAVGVSRIATVERKRGGVVSVPKTIVVIEDDRDIRSLIQGILTGAGLEVHEAGTGAAGVEAVRQHGPDTVVADYGLPDFSGIEVVRQIREFSRAPVLMLTGHGDLAGIPDAAGVNDLMAKPFSPRELRRRVEKLLVEHSQPSADRPAVGRPD